MGCHFLLYRIFPTQGSNKSLQHAADSTYCTTREVSILATPVFWPGEFRRLLCHRVAKSWTEMSDFHFHIYLDTCVYVCLYVCVCVCVGFPGGVSGKEPIRQCRRRKKCRFNSWVGKIPWRKACQPTSIYLCVYIYIFATYKQKNISLIYL